MVTVVLRITTIDRITSPPRIVLSFLLELLSVNDSLVLRQMDNPGPSDLPPIDSGSLCNSLWLSSGTPIAAVNGVGANVWYPLAGDVGEGEYAGGASPGG